MARPLRGALRARRSTRIEEEGDRKHDAMANMVARPQSLQDYLHDQLGWFELEPPNCGQMCDRIIYNLDANGYLQGRLEDLIEPDAPARAVGPGPAGAGRGAEARSARRGGPRPARMPAAAAHARHALLRAAQDADLEPPGRPRAQPPAGHRAADRLFDRADPGDAGRAAQAESQAGRRISATRSCPTSRPTCSSSWATTASTRSAWKTAARRSLFISPYYRKLLTSGEANAETREYIKRKINSAQWLIESIEQRRNTLTRVAQAIVDHQTEFLEQGARVHRAA